MQGCTHLIFRAVANILFRYALINGQNVVLPRTSNTIGAFERNATAFEGIPWHLDQWNNGGYDVLTLHANWRTNAVRYVTTQFVYYIYR